MPRADNPFRLKYAECLTLLLVGAILIAVLLPRCRPSESPASGSTPAEHTAKQPAAVP